MTAVEEAESVSLLSLGVSKLAILEHKNKTITSRKPRFLQKRHSKYLSEDKRLTSGQTGHRGPTETAYVSDESTQNLLLELDCAHLAEHVVKQAKERWRWHQKALHETTPNRIKKLPALISLDVTPIHPSAAATMHGANPQPLKRTVYLPGETLHLSRSRADHVLVTRCSPKTNRLCFVNEVKGSKPISDVIGDKNDTQLTRAQKVAEIKGQQRAEIYAINKHMTEFEEQNFRVQAIGKV